MIDYNVICLTMRHAFAIALLILAGASQARAETGRSTWLPHFGEQPVLALVEATSRTLLHSGEIDFALSIDVDIDAETPIFTLDDILVNNAKAPRYAIVFEVAQATASRRVMGLKPVRSTVFLGYANRPYTIDDADPIAGMDFTNRLSSPGNPLAGLNDAQQAVGPPLIFDYAFDKADIQARRTMTVHAYLVDRQEQTYVPTTFDVSETRRFEVAYRISHYDPKRKQLAENYDREDDVDDFERVAMAVKLSKLLKAFDQHAPEQKHYASATELRHILLTGRNETLTKLNANAFDARPLNDPRFDSVVAIYTGKGAMGSGFFVTPDVVLTNWHVVDEHRFVEMKMYDGRETFGTVLGKDARLDVALVKVQDRGRPVAFYTGRRIDVGQDVEAIGHPHRLEFSITRGVISAVRKHHSINLPRGAGDDVLYIQTDAPINPGNSGGPLFLDNRVIGMNTWGASKDIAEGLNFSIHYGELMNFMNEHLPGYFVSPAGDIPQ